MQSIRKPLITLTLGFVFQVSAFAQQYEISFYRVMDGSDTIFGAALPEIEIHASISAYQRKYNQAKRYVVKCLSLANFIRDMTHDIDGTIAGIDKRRQKRKYLKSERDKLFETFSDIVKDMSVNEGNYFNKLVYRQTGTTTYAFIKKYQGMGKAAMWQTISRIGGANLKLTYDPYYTDKVTEDVMRDVEAGKIRIPRLPRNVEEFNNPVYE